MSSWIWFELIIVIIMRELHTLIHDLLERMKYIIRGVQRRTHSLDYKAKVLIEHLRLNIKAFFMKLRKEMKG